MTRKASQGELSPTWVCRSEGVRAELQVADEGPMGTEVRQIVTAGTDARRVRTEQNPIDLKSRRQAATAVDQIGRNTRGIGGPLAAPDSARAKGIRQPGARHGRVQIATNSAQQHTSTSHPGHSLDTHLMPGSLGQGRRKM